MPEPLLKEGFSFYFWSDEGSELPHAHVLIARAMGWPKWWLLPELHIEYSNGFKKQEQRRIRELIEEHHETLIKAWEKHFGPRR